jgi:uncharacterized surface protein with fasciclin (FAS1) repeats
MMPVSPGATVGDIVEADPDLSTFNNLMRRSGVIKELDGEGPYTVLAPTNAAFELLPDGALGALVDHPDRLRQVIAYHAVKGAIRAGALREFDSLPTLYGDDVSVIATGEGVVVGSAGIEEADLAASNGLVHKISNVLFPSDS